MSISTTEVNSLPVSLDAQPNLPALRLEAKSLQVRQFWAALITIVLPTLVALFAFFRAYTEGVAPAALWAWACMHLATMLGITVGYHRFAAHKSFETAGLTRAVLVVLGSMAAQGPVIHWVSDHRRHHQYSDKDGDVHSPHVRRGAAATLLTGFWHSHVGWMFDGDITNPVRYSKDLLRDPAVNRLNRLYLLWVLLGLTLPAALVGAVTRSWTAAVDTLLWAGFVRVFTVHHATWAVNSVTHLWGSSPFRSADRSVNVAWLAIPTAGESWHNCHHAFPGSARFGLAWWQLDLGYVLIWTLARLALARDVRQPSPSARASAYKTAASHSQDSRVRAP